MICIRTWNTSLTIFFHIHGLFLYFYCPCNYNMEQWGIPLSPKSMLGWDYAINPYWMAHSNISIYWRPQLSYISSQQACITLFSDSLCQNELIRSLFLREVGMVQDESCGTNGCFCRESPLKLALKRSLNCFSKLKENGSGSSVFTDPSIATWRQDHFHRSSGVATPGTQLQM